MTAKKQPKRKANARSSLAGGFGNLCTACGMVLRTPAEYHPYAACLMFKACGDSDTVRINLSAAGADTLRMDKLASRWDSQGKGHHICRRWVPNVTGSFRDAIDALPNDESEARRD